MGLSLINAMLFNTSLNILYLFPLATLRMTDANVLNLLWRKNHVEALLLKAEIKYLCTVSFHAMAVTAGLS